MPVSIIAILLYGPEGGSVSSTIEHARHVALRMNPAFSIFLLIPELMEYTILVSCWASNRKIHP